MSDFVDNLVDNAATLTATATSAIFTRPPASPSRGEHKGIFFAQVTGSISGTGTPTLSYQLQASMDGTNFANVGAAVAFTAAGAGRIEFSGIEPYWQVVKTVSGTTPSFGGVTSHLVFSK